MNKIFHILRSIYWNLPSWMQEKLKKPARYVSNCIQSISAISIKKDNLNWKQFRDNILIHSKSYKGIFVQSVTIDWAVDLYQRPQHIASAMAKLGYLVIYCTKNTQNDNVNGFKQILPNVWLTNIDVINKIENAVVSIYSTAYTAPLNILNNKSNKNLIVYEYIDHIDPKISGNSENIIKLQNIKNLAFSGKANAIIASSAALYKDAAENSNTENVLFIPNGVDVNHYKNTPTTPIDIKQEYLLFIKKHKIIVGYFGALAPWIWYEELNKLIANRPDIGFIFIGPDYYGGFNKLQKHANLMLTGPINYELLPAYAKMFDICIIPFEPGEIARTTSPLKLFEYFALQKPIIVSSYMDECTIYEEVLSASNAEEFSDMIDVAIKMKDNPHLLAKLADLANSNSWTERAKIYENLFKGINI